MTFRKMVGALLVLAMITLVLPGAAFAADPVVTFDDGALEDGVVRIRYNREETLPLKVKVMHVASGEKRYYDLALQTMETYPLQMGNGSYQVSVLRQIEGTRYRSVASETMELSLLDDRVVYLNSVQNVSWDEEDAFIDLAKSLTEGLEDDRAKVKAVYDYVTGRFSYDYDKAARVRPGYRTDNASFFEQGKGICYDYSALTASMLRSVGIPTKLTKGYSTRMSGYHAWNQVYLEGQGWVDIDTTVDAYYQANGYACDMVKAASEYQETYSI